MFAMLETCDNERVAYPDSSNSSDHLSYIYKLFRFELRIIFYGFSKFIQFSKFFAFI